MPFMQWTEMLRIDGALVDTQHRGLFDAVNAFQESVAQGHEAEAVAATLDFLKEYGTRHFTDEEQMLAEAGYPHLDQHRRQHQLFIDQIGAFRTQLVEGGSGLGYSMSQFLGSWLVNHIMVSDKAYAAFLRSSARLPVPDGSRPSSA